MARFIGLSVQKGAVASPFIVRSSEYTRATGIGTTASPGSGNNVTEINDENGNWTIDNILYDSVRTGIITHNIQKLFLEYLRLSKLLTIPIKMLHQLRS